MSQTSATVTFTDLVSSSLNNVRATVADNIFKKSAFWAFLMNQGKKDRTASGPKIQRAVEYGTNSTVTPFNGYDLVPIVPQEIITDSLWDWKEVAGNVVISRREERINSGDPQIRSLIQTKIGNLERSFGESLNTQVLNPTSFSTANNGGKGLTPLTQLIPLAANTVGGINGSTSTWWDVKRDKAGSSNNTAQAGTAFLQELRSFYNTCGQNNDGFPNMILAGKELAETYEAVLDTRVRYTDTAMADLGFDNVKLKGATVLWDQITPGTSANGAAYADYGSKVEECAFFLNTDFLYLVVDEGTDMVMTPFVDHQPGGQYAKSASMLFMGELICTNRRAQGVYFGADISAITLTT